MEALLDGHDTADPVTGIVGGHPYATLGFRFWLAALLQIACPPSGPEEAVDRLFHPPAPAALRAALERCREALWLSGVDKPLFQVCPTADWKPDPQRIAGLLPDTPTANAIDKGEDFFAKRDMVRAIDLSLMPGILYAHMVLFPSGGGGYLTLPHAAGSPKYAVVGRTLWESLWANVLPTDTAPMRRGPWPAPCDGSVFPWLRDDLRRLALSRIPDNKRAKLRAAGEEVPDTLIKLSASALHPAAIPMPRRYLLAPPEEGVCSLTGRRGLVVTAYNRWTQGLDYQDENWFHPVVAHRVTCDPKAEPPEKVTYPQAGGPLRLDDWLGVAVGRDPEPPPPGADTRKSVLYPPAVLRSFRRLADLIGEHVAGETDDAATALGVELPFRVLAVAQFSLLKAVGGMSERTLPVYALPQRSAEELAGRTAALVEEVAALAGDLRRHAADAVRQGNRERMVALAADLADSLMARLEPLAVEAIGSLAVVLGKAGPFDDTAAVEALAITRNVGRTARIAALDLFDGAFPIATLTQMDRRILEIRGRLEAALFPAARQAKTRSKAARPCAQKESKA